MALRNIFRCKSFVKNLNQVVDLKSLHDGHNLFPKYFIRALNTQQCSDLLFRQLFDHESCTYTYLLGDTASKEAVLIDPVIQLAERDLEMLREMRVNLKYVINTHVHADHITGSGLLKKYLPNLKSIISEYSKATADIHVKDGDTIKYGNQCLEVRSTPGHTNGKTVTTVEEEKNFNPRLTKSEEEFIKIMDNLNLPYPDKIDVSLPANKVCGLYNLPNDVAKLFDNSK